VIASEAQRAIAPDVIVLWGFGLIASIAALLVVLLVISRQLNALDEVRKTLIALGASTPMNRGRRADRHRRRNRSWLVVGSCPRHLPLAPVADRPVRLSIRLQAIAFDWTVLALA